MATRALTRESGAVPPDVTRANVVRLLASAIALVTDPSIDLGTLLAELGARPGARYATAADNPLGSERSFLDAARRGDFESFKRGRHVVARWSDVEAAIERRKRSVRLAPVAADDDRAELIAAGVPMRPRRARGR